MVAIEDFCRACFLNNIFNFFQIFQQKKIMMLTPHAPHVPGKLFVPLTRVMWAPLGAGREVTYSRALNDDFIRHLLLLALNKQMKIKSKYIHMKYAQSAEWERVERELREQL